MFVELIESLRCPRPHEESQLVASATRTESRHIVEGILGCPVCGAEFLVRNGVAQFGEPVAPTPPEPASVETAMRLAAFLDLTDARGFALLGGRWGAQADQIQRLAETPLVLVNPPDVSRGDVAGVIHTRDVVGFASSSARAAALDARMSADLIASMVRAVRAGGRIVAAASLQLPDGVAELVRDESVWVGEKIAAPGGAPRLVSIERQKR